MTKTASTPKFKLQATLDNFLQVIVSGRRPASRATIADALLWPVGELGEALHYLAQKSGMPVAAERAGTVGANSPKLPPGKMRGGGQENEALDRWIGGLAGQMGLETEPLQTTYAEAEQYLCGAGPVLLKLSDDKDESAPQFVALFKRGAALAPSHCPGWLCPTGRARDPSK